jgi:ketosteroid isomerase-like protein
MKLATIAALVSLFALMALSLQKEGQGAEAAGGSPVSSVVESKIREAWQDFKEKKADAYAALLDDDFTAVEIDGKGPHDKKPSVAEVIAGTLNSYSLNDLKVIALGPNTALATYTANTHGIMPDGKIVHGTVAATDIWVRRAGNWKNLRYHESELK